MYRAETRDWISEQGSGVPWSRASDSFTFLVRKPIERLQNDQSDHKQIQNKHKVMQNNQKDTKQPQRDSKERQRKVK